MNLGVQWIEDTPNLSAGRQDTRRLGVAKAHLRVAPPGAKRSAGRTSLIWKRVPWTNDSIAQGALVETDGRPPRACARWLLSIAQGAQPGAGICPPQTGPAARMRGNEASGITWTDAIQPLRGRTVVGISTTGSPPCVRATRGFFIAEAAVKDITTAGLRPAWGAGL